MRTRPLSFVLVVVLAFGGLGGCASSKQRPRSVPEAPAVMPSGHGTRRALVVVEGEVPSTKKAQAAQDDELATPRILRKVLGPDSP